MAKFELKFIDFWQLNNDYIKVDFIDYKSDEPKDLILISGSDKGNNFKIFLDKSTAIKFAKTLRTEINKIEDKRIIPKF